MCHLLASEPCSASLQSLGALASAYCKIAYNWLLGRRCWSRVHVLSGERVHRRKYSFTGSYHILWAEEVDSVLLLGEICGLLFLISLPQSITNICVLLHLFCVADLTWVDDFQFFKRVYALRASS